VNVFDLDRALITDYERFARSFTKIRAADIWNQIDAIYATGAFWPEPLITINPHFERGAKIDELVADGTLRPETGRVFRADGKTLELYRHQAQAISKAAAGQSFVVSTGTGSGKSLCFFVPIIDRAIRARLAGDPPRTKAIIVYPMNALANSQINEIRNSGPKRSSRGHPTELRAIYRSRARRRSRSGSAAGSGPGAISPETIDSSSFLGTEPSSSAFGTEFFAIQFRAGNWVQFRLGNWDFVFHPPDPIAFSQGASRWACRLFGCLDESLGSFHSGDATPFIRRLLTAFHVDVRKSEAVRSTKTCGSSAALFHDLDKAERDQFADGRGDCFAADAPLFELIERH
jgi:hypothetical protein